MEQELSCRLEQTANQEADTWPSPFSTAAPVGAPYIAWWGCLCTWGYCSPPEGNCWWANLSEVQLGDPGSKQSVFSPWHHSLQHEAARCLQRRFSSTTVNFPHRQRWCQRAKLRASEAISPGPVMWGVAGRLAWFQLLPGDYMLPGLRQ